MILTEGGDNARKMQNSQFSERVSQVGLHSGSIMLKCSSLCMPLEVLVFSEHSLLQTKHTFLGI